MLSDDELAAIEKRANLTDLGLRYIPPADVFTLLSEVRSQQSSLRGASIWQTNMQKEIDRLRKEVEMIKGVREVMDDATIAAVYLTQELRIATLEADLRLTRHQLNYRWLVDSVGDMEVSQFRPAIDYLNNLGQPGGYVEYASSDGWRVGERVPS